MQYRNNKHLILPALAIATLSIAAILMTGCASLDKITESKLLFSYKPVRKAIWSAKGTAETPVILEDTIYFLSGYPWNNQVFLHAIDRKTGKEKWTCKDELSQFVLDGDQIYGAGRTNLFRSEPGHVSKCFLRAYSAKTGTTLWDVPSITDRRGVKIIGFDKYVYALANKEVSVVDKEKGIVVCKGQERILPSVVPNILTENGYIFAELFDRSIGKFFGATGKLEGKVQLDPIASELPRVLIIKAGMLFIAGGDGKSEIINLVSNRRESVETGWLTSKLKLADNVAFFGSQTGPLKSTVEEKRTIVVSGEKASSGNEKKPNAGDEKKPNAGDEKKTDASDEKKTNAVEEKPDNNGFYMCAYDLLTTKYKWKTAVETHVRSGPLIFNGVVYAGAVRKDKSYLYAFNAVDGKVQWQSECLTPLSDVAHGNGMIFVNGGGVLNAVDATTGKSLWTYALKDAAIVGDPVFEDGIVYVAADDSNLYALKANKEQQ